MTKKKKQTVWNKKSGKFIPSSVLKPHHPVKDGGGEEKAREDRKTQRLRVFARGLSARIKKAAREETGDK